MNDYLILVPKTPQLKAMIDRASGIVAASRSDGRLLCYYEGNRFNVRELRSFENRLKQAAGRLLRSYPTIAMAMFPASELTVVGTYSPSRWAVASITDPITLAEWIAPEILPLAEITP